MNDIILFESKTKTYLERSRVPKVENLRIWLSNHPSYELIKPAMKQQSIQRSKPKVKPVKPLVNETSPIENIRKKVSTDFYDRIIMRYEKFFFVFFETFLFILYSLDLKKMVIKIISKVILSIVLTRLKPKCFVSMVIQAQPIDINIVLYLPIYPI